MNKKKKVAHDEVSLVFGPIPSRRLGRSLGINNIPPKACSYSCVYCQVGPTTDPEIAPRHFHSPESIRVAVAGHVNKLRQRGEPVDYLTFVPDGEPTLDAHLGEAIEALKPLGIPVAVISNASLVWRPEVRAALSRADWVSLKVDAVDESIWRQVNRPHPDLSLEEILQGIRTFARDYEGTLVSETMLVEGINDSEASLAAVARFLEQIRPQTAYLAIPTRPPAVPGTRGPDEGVINRAYQIFAAHLERVELLVGYEGDAFASTGDARADLLSITAVHPMRERAVRALLERCGEEWSLVECLMDEGLLREVTHEGSRFYVRRLPREHQSRAL